MFNITVETANLDKWKKSLENKLEIAAVRGWETAVELTPARGETPYSTGRMREAIRFQKTGGLEFTIFSPARHSIYYEFGTGPKGKQTGAVEGVKDDPHADINYHTGEVKVVRHAGKLLSQPYIRRTQGQVAQPFLRPALLEAQKVFKDLLKDK